jgi:hypothetical protein
MLTFLGLVLLAGGCCWPEKLPTPPLGTQSDQNWRRMEAGAAASDFVIYQSEFSVDPKDENKIQLNAAGEDHLRSIAARLQCGAPLPVVIERGNMSKRADTEYQYPVHPNPELDMKRRDYVAKTLVAMGITNADQCVIVAPAMAEGYKGTEAARAYARGLATSGHENNASTGGLAVVGTVR